MKASFTPLLVSETTIETIIYTKIFSNQTFVQSTYIGPLLSLLNASRDMT